MAEDTAQPEGDIASGPVPQPGEPAGGLAPPWRDTAGVPEPPWRASRKPAGRAPLTREAIVDAALLVLDAEGVDGLSMRRVGERLGAGAASIYWHVRNKDELLQLVFERVISEIELPVPDPSRWREQLRMLVAQMRAVLNRHRDVARLTLGRVPTGPSLAVFTEWLFTLLTPVGIPDRVIAYLGDLFGLYVGAFSFEESLGVETLTGPDLTPEQFFTMLRDYIASLPEDRFPHTRRAVDLIFSDDREDRFMFGVDLMIRGLASYADQAPD
jgi:TetR/AcrR family tetracycline transcriptional repressor